MTCPHKSNKYNYLNDPSKSVINYQYKAQPGHLYLKTIDQVNDYKYEPNDNIRQPKLQKIGLNQQNPEKPLSNHNRNEKTPTKRINYEYTILNSSQDLLSNKIYQHNLLEQSNKKQNNQNNSNQKDDPYRIIKNSHIRDLQQIDQWSSYESKNLKSNPKYIPKPRNLVESRTFSKSPLQRYKVQKKQTSNSRVQMNAIYLPISHQHQKELLVQHQKKVSSHNVSKQNLSEDVTFRNQMGGFRLGINSDNKKKINNTPYRYIHSQCQNNPQIYFPKKIEEELHFHKKSHSAYTKTPPKKYPIQFPFE